MTVAEAAGARCLLVESAAPAPGRQRNAGWRSGSAPLVQFLDSDTELDADWLRTAATAFEDPSVGAAYGLLREAHPEASVFNWIGGLEWNGPAGDAESFGGIVMLSRAALEATGGYDDALVAGEDPELARRVREAGFRILSLDQPMVTHDLAMRTLRQYWRRAYRSGHAFAEVHARHPDFWGREVRRILLRTAPFLVGLAALPLATVSPWFLLAPSVGAALLFRPSLCLAGRFAASLGLSRREARAYALHASLVVLPQSLGMARFHYGRLFGQPLANKRPRAAP